MYSNPQGSRHSGSGQQGQNNPGYTQQPHPYSNYQQPQYHQQEMMNPPQGRSSQYGQYGQPYPGKNMQLPQPPTLIQPPALNVEETINTNSQFLPQRGPMTVSNNQNLQFEGYHNQEQDPGWNQEEHIASVFWEQRCITMLDRFQWFFQRFQILRDQYVSLSEEMQKMDSEDEWHHFQQHHDQFHEKIIQMEQELAAVVGENQQLLQQKMEHDSESVWEQRYQQLLGNFKSLQQEMAHMEANGGGDSGGVPPEQYQQLEDQYGQLEYQYGEVVKELQKQQEGFEFREQLEMQINEYRQEIDSYKNNFENLHNENVELQNMVVDLQNQNQAMGERFGSTVDRSKFEQLASLIEQKEREIQAMQNDFKTRSSNHQGSLSQYESALNQKNIQIEQLRRLLTSKDRERQEEVSRLQSVIGESEGLKEAYQQKICQLEKTISSFKLKKQPDSSAKCQNLEKKLAYSNQEIANLNETLKSKNQELTELRSLSYEVDRLKDIQNNYNRVVDERDRVADTLKRKHGEIEAMHKEIENLTIKIQEVSNKRQEYSTRNLMAEIEDLNDYIRRNEGEILKLKNIIELKEEYSLKLEEEIRKINDKYIVTEQTLFLERDNWKEKQIKLSSKNIEHQKRIKNLDYEFNLQLKDTLEKEVKVLRNQITEKQEIVRTMEEKEIVLSSQLAVFEKQKGNFDRDISLIKKKEKELESLNEAQARRYKQLESSFAEKQQQLDAMKLKYVALNSQLNSSKTQEQELHSVIRNKSKKIQELQRQIVEYVGKSEIVDKLRNENGKLKLALEAAQEEAERLKIQGESRIGYSKISSSSNLRPTNDKQENVVINQLQQENQYLKEQIAKNLQKLTVSRGQTHQEQSDKKSQKYYSDKKEWLQQKGKSTSQVRIDLNRRLNEFNAKLQSTINHQEGGQGLQHSRSQQLVSFLEQQRKNLIEKHEVEVRQLKNQLRQEKMERNSQITQNSRVESPKKQAVMELEVQKVKEEIEFYKQKNKELQNRTQNLIKINEELREKIDSVLKLKQTTTTADYYKDQNKQLENENEGLKAKIKKISEENKELKIELFSKKSKISQQYEFKMLELELVIQDLKRKVTLLQAGKPKEKQEKASKYTYDMNIFQTEVNKPSYDKRPSFKELAVSDYPKKYTGIQQEFQSVLGNFKHELPKNYDNRYGASVNLSSYAYGQSRLEEEKYRVQRQ